MLTMLYRFLVRFRRNDEFTRDMIATFEEAQADAKARGFVRYAGFGLRELAGLMLAPKTAKRRWPTVAAWGLAGLMVGAAVCYVRPPQYSSEAFLRMSPPAISESLYPSDPSLNVDRLLSTVLPRVLSRTVLTTVINTFDLYPRARTRQPIQTVIERMQRDIRIERQGENVILVEFTYGESPWGSLHEIAPEDQTPTDRPDRYVAQRVVRDLVSRVIDENIRNTINQAYMTRQFFEDRSAQAATRWETLNASLLGLPATDRRYDRAVLDRDLARKEYESLREKYSGAETIYDLAKRRQTRYLELLDPASLPMIPDTSPLLIVLGGFAAGLLIGTLWTWLRTTPGNSQRLLPGLAEG